MALPLRLCPDVGTLPHTAPPRENIRAGPDTGTLCLPVPAGSHAQPTEVTGTWSAHRYHSASFNRSVLHVLFVHHDLRPRGINKVAPRVATVSGGHLIL